ncbi:CBS domain-containing protein [Exilibacterium tricleocarpae]|uniref:CBS domain-containing protein n=1 Tax=Exilibacterium tricleocarpae TaxID=2591008 RepID=A0A545TV66_9GAMM|nr:CBS domain-containing protein [Exilibacterium tricleocarpae]TQV81112.1 CBS domain-containing protein [Exilibacterium tricleocarpae]
MNVGAYCSRTVVYVYGQETPLEAARIMREQHVGDVVIIEDHVDQHGEKKVPIGIVTDRDIAIEIVAEEVDPTEVSVLDVCRKNLVVVSENDDLSECISLLKREGVRRAPVVDEEGFLVGIIAVDDILEILAEQLSDLADLVGFQAEQEVLAT